MCGIVLISPTAFDRNGLYFDIGEMIGGGLLKDSILIGRSFSSPTRLVRLSDRPGNSAGVRGPETGSAN